MIHHHHGRGGVMLPIAGNRFWPDLAAMNHALAAGEGVLELQPVMQADQLRRPVFHEGRLRLVGPGGQQIMAGAFGQILGRGGGGMIWASLPGRRGADLGRQIDRLSLELGLSLLTEHPGMRMALDLDPLALADAAWMQILQDGAGRDDDLAGRLILMVDQTHLEVMPARLGAFMRAWQPLGVGFALSARWRGGLSLGRSRDFCFDMLRLDLGQGRRPDDQKQVQALFAAARACDMLGLAAGVESAADARLLIDIGVEFLQGPCFGLPDILPRNPVPPSGGGLYSV